jgi:hypothetical protein
MHLFSAFINFLHVLLDVISYEVLIVAGRYATFFCVERILVFDIERQSLISFCMKVGDM